MDDMYREIILEHYKQPQNYGVLENSLHHKESNPLCGDEFDVYIRIENEEIKGIAFSGKGCAISTASASLLTEKVKGMTVRDVLALSDEEVVENLGIEINPARMKCATLILKGIKNTVNKQ